MDRPPESTTPSIRPRDTTPSYQQRRSPSRRSSRRYGFACNKCKHRKVKCSGEQPTCYACRRSGTACIWRSRTETVTQLQNAQSRIKHLEASLREANSRSRTTPNIGSSTIHVSESPAAASVPGPSSLISPSSDGPYPTPSHSLWFQVGVGNDGAVTYNGPTSRFHAGPLEEDHDADQVENNHAGVEILPPSPHWESHIDALHSQYGFINTVWLPLISSKPTIQGSGIETRICTALLDIYWTWLQPLHNCVYKPVFLMDMAIGGPYYSDFLLMSILSLAARHISEQDTKFRGINKGEQFLSRAKDLLLEEMSATKPKITTIQGLLVLGGRQCAMGQSSEGWLYTGMAIRMLVDIGLHLYLDNSKLANLERLTPAEVETRKRLYNAAYIWDKTLSLALGRPPSLTRRPHGADDLLDRYDDLLEWKPIYAPEVAGDYAPAAAYNTMAFCAHCQLHEITTKMMLLFSSTSTIKDFAAGVNVLGSEFECWYSNIPEQLRINNPSSLSQSPPPHVVSLNLLYHALCILLHRPNLSSHHTPTLSASRKACISHSKSIYNIFTLYNRTFPYRLMTYQVSYCIFTAATVDAHEMKTHGVEGVGRDAAIRLGAAIRVLQDEARHTPGIGRSLDTIRRRLTTWKTGHGVSSPVATAQRDRQQSPSLPEQGVASLSSLIEGGRNYGATSNFIGAVPGNSSTTTIAVDTATAGGQISPIHQSRDTPETINNNASEQAENSHPLEGIGSSEGAFDFAGLNTGAGFHPDAFPWSMAESLTRDGETFSSYILSGLNDVGAVKEFF